jgi:hypothetical protein
MKDFKTISEGVENWNTIARNLTEANEILSIPVQFPINAPIPLDTTLANVNVYLGYTENTLFAVLIQSSNDVLERYQNDLDGVLNDLIIVTAVSRLSPIVAGLYGSTTLFENEISQEDALQRIESWQNTPLRMKVMRSVNTAPLIFEVPKSNFEFQGKNKLLFGLKTVKKRWFYKQMQYDLLLESNTEDGNLRENQIYFDVAKPIPPFNSVSPLGLYEYLGLSI